MVVSLNLEGFGASGYLAMSRLVVIILLCLSNVNGDGNADSNFCVHPPGKTDSIDKKYFAFAESAYKVQTEIRKADAKGPSPTVSFVSELSVPSSPVGKTGLIVQDQEASSLSTIQWIVNVTGGVSKIAFRIEGQDCITTTKTPKENPFLLDPTFLDKDAPAPLTLADLISMAKSGSTYIDKAIDTLDGIKVSCFFQCANVTAEKDAVLRELHVCFSDDAVKYPAPKQLNVPVSFSLKTYKPSSNDTVLQTFYDFSAFSPSLGTVAENETHLLPPLGVYCENKATLPKLNDSFEVSIELVDVNQNLIDNSLLVYDQTNKLASFTYSPELSNNEPFESGLGLTTKEKLRVVHDFSTGVEYLTDKVDHTCIGMNQIPKEAGDLSPSGSAVVMKSPDTILFPGDTTWSYVGQRTHAHATADVYVAKVNASTSATDYRTIVYELYMSPKDWENIDVFGGTQNASIPVALNTYRYDQKSQLYNVTYQHFENFVVYKSSEQRWPIKEFNVEACLPDSDDSFWIVQVDASVDTIAEVSRKAFEAEFISRVAAVAGIRPIRVRSVMLAPMTSVKKDGSYVMFVIMETSNVSAPAYLSGAKTDPTLAVANKVLKDAFAKDVPLNVPHANGTQVFILKKDTLKAASVYLNANETHHDVIYYNKGYSNGSMAALGIIMLMIGTACGLGGAWYLWKRNRGIAYQVYE